MGSLQDIPERNVESPPSCSPVPSPQSTASYETESSTNDLEECDHGYNTKPKIPYVSGYKFTVQRHTPPDPFGGNYDTDWPLERGNWEELSQLENCLARSPLPGETHEDDTRALEITSRLHVGYDRGAQLVVVNNDMVAKIYDPLYYAGYSEHGYIEDVVPLADGDYSREANAYNHLQKSEDAKRYTPTYHGSWTMEVDTLDPLSENQVPRKRQVRLILIELVNGTCMANIDPYDLPRKVRSNTVKKVLEAESYIFHAGVRHEDTCPRNVIILGDIRSPKSQVKIIDFNVASIAHLDSQKDYYCRLIEQLRVKNPGKMVSPIPRFWDEGIWEFCGWAWTSDKENAGNEWLWKHFHGNEKYIAVERDWENLKEEPWSRGWKELEQESLERVRS
jgi:hypothetical protein